MVIDEFQSGQRVRVVQQMPQRDEVWTHSVEGTVLAYTQAPTGSWFARNRNGKLWLDRLTLQLDDGEEVTLNLDRYSHVELLETTEEAKPKEDEEADAKTPETAPADETESGQTPVTEKASEETPEPAAKDQKE